MRRQRIPAYILLIALASLGVFIDAPVFPRHVKFPCYVGANYPGQRPAYYLNATEWESPSFALFGFGVDIHPADPCPYAV